MDTIVNKETKIALFKEMLRIRLAEEKVVELYPQQEMRCPVHLSIGQEASPVGISAHLTDEDYVMSTHRAHAHYLAKGADMKAMMAEFYGRETGCCHGVGGSMHLIDLSVGFLGAVPIVGSTIPIGVGAALGSIMQKREGRVVVIYLGDGSTEEGVFHESINFAVLRNLPVIFLCENNFYSVYSNLSVRQPKGRKIHKIAEAYGVPSEQGDGNDVLEVYAMSGRAVEKARNGGGPTFLEFITYRWREHCGPNYDNNIGYRTQEEFERWKKLCPIARLKKDLLEENGVQAHQLEAIEQELKDEINEAVQFAKDSPFPDADRLVKNLYDTKTEKGIFADEQTAEILPSHQ